jgi:hypothetical protein
LIKINTRFLDQNPEDFQGSSDGSKHLVELTRNQFTICFRRARKERQTRNPACQGKNHFNYGNKNSNTNVPSQHQCTVVGWKEKKEEVPIFTNGTQNEVIIKTI